MSLNFVYKEAIPEKSISFKEKSSFLYHRRCKTLGAEWLDERVQIKRKSKKPNKNFIGMRKQFGALMFNKTGFARQDQS